MLEGGDAPPLTAVEKIATSKPAMPGFDLRGRFPTREKPTAKEGTP